MRCDASAPVISRLSRLPTLSLSIFRFRSAGGGGRRNSGPRPSTTHSFFLLGPLVDDHLIYCNITHTKAINQQRRPKWGELKDGKGMERWASGRTRLTCSLRLPPCEASTTWKPSILGLIVRVVLLERMRTGSWEKGPPAKVVYDGLRMAALRV